MTRRRWWTPSSSVLLMLCAMYFITYVDRVNVSSAAEAFQKELGFSKTELGFVFSAFAYPYLVCQVIGGWFGDRFGARRTLIVCGLTWAVATLLTGLVGGLTSMVAARVLLGLGEGATFPTATRAMSTWLPGGKSGWAQGITHSAARLGNAITPPAVVWLTAATSWRGAFILMGAVSIVWVVAWGLIYRDDPRTHPRMTPEDIAALPVQRPKAALPTSWGPLLRRMAPVTFVYFCYGWTLWTFLSWVPQFMLHAYNLRITQSAVFASAVFFGGVVGDALGGWVSDWLLRRTGSLTRARRDLVVFGMAGSFLCSAPVLFVTDPTLAALALGGAFFFAELTIGPMWAIPMDIAPQHSGTASGLMNSGSALAAILSPVVFGWIIDRTNNWSLPFYGTMALLAVGMVAAFLMKPDQGFAVSEPPGSAPLPDGSLPRGATPLGDTRLARRLRKETQAEILFGRGDRGRYATDASIYQVEPVGVIVPRTIDDVMAAMAIAREHGVPVLPRGGGTSQCGQTVNRALVIDCSKHLRRVLEIDAANNRAWVEPGLVLAHLNAALKPHGLFFPVDPSTNARCTIGGMAGNNSCGGKSIRYGLMADNVHAIDAILADGTRHTFGALPDNLGADLPAGVAALIQQLRALGATEAEEIAARFPNQLRRVGGYNLEVLTPTARHQGRENLARLLVGSEGTLAFSAALELQLHPILPRRVVGICQFPTFRAAMAASARLVQLDPEAVELVDSTMIDLGRGIDIYRPTIDRMVQGHPDSLLLVEFHGHEDAPLLRKLAELDEAMADLGYPGAVVRATDPAFQAAIAQVREAGLNIMMSMKGDGKPVSFIEDCAVGLDDLADYTERLNDVFERHGTKGTWYAHASVGCLHVRPVLNMKDPADVRTMRTVAEECFALVREYKGSHSGEHGDGIVRSEFHREMFGPRIVSAFEAVKDAFDPGALLNPGRVVRPPRMDDRSLFRYAPDYAADEGFTPRLDWSAWPGPQGGLLSAVEMCNNNGTCRSFDGTMCPSYRVTRDESAATRGRANTLRLALTGQLGPDAMAGNDVAEALKLCVSCKACKRECPTGVDMARMKLEATAARAKRRGVPLRERLVAELPRYAPLASRLAPLANLRNRSRLLRRLSERTLGFAASRALPEWSPHPFRNKEAPPPDAGLKDVLLFADTFNRWFEPENLRAAIRVLAAAGFRAIVPPGRLCCGRTYLSAGLLDQARAEARRTLAALAGTLPVVGLEPSCLLTLRDEFLSLLPGPEAEALAARATLIGEFLARHAPDLPFTPTPSRAHVHGHCHQKAMNALPDSLATLNRVPGLDVKPITSSCCGMAGAFGYQSETQHESRAMAEASLLPAIRAADPDDLVVADGTSCRHQIAELSGRQAVHSVILLDRALR